MTPARRVKSRTQPCSGDHAPKRLADARQFLELAELASEETETASFGVSAANAVLAGMTLSPRASAPVCDVSCGSSSANSGAAGSHLAISGATGPGVA
jgi:hypothetical protein